MKITSANEPDVTHCYGFILVPWVWFPYGMPMIRIPDEELLTENTTAIHLG
jgi:hypothetical protein